MQTCPGFLLKSLLESPGNLLEICSVKFVDTLNTPAARFWLYRRRRAPRLNESLVQGQGAESDMQDFLVSAGDLCSEPDDCASEPCQNGGECSSSLLGSGYTCQCTDGFDGPTCDRDINECSDVGGDVCENGGTCFNTHGSYRSESYPRKTYEVS